jgi:hypothetical protein
MGPYKGLKQVLHHAPFIHAHGLNGEYSMDTKWHCCGVAAVHCWSRSSRPDAVSMCSLCRCDA